MTAIHRLPDVTTVQAVRPRRRAITVGVAAILAAISASAVCGVAAAAGTADKPRPSPDRLWQTFPLDPQRPAVPGASEAAQTVPVSSGREFTPPPPQLVTRSQPTPKASGKRGGAAVAASSSDRGIGAVAFLGIASAVAAFVVFGRWRGRSRKPGPAEGDGAAAVACDTPKGVPARRAPAADAPPADDATRAPAPAKVRAPQPPPPAAAPVPVAAPPPAPVDDEHEDDEDAEAAAVTGPARSRPADSEVDEVLHDAVSDDAAVDAAVARAQRDRTAVSLVVVRAATDDEAEEILDAITEAAPAGAWNASSRFGGKHWLILYGVLPKRARDLADAVLHARPSLDALLSLHGAGVGVAGFPRHARSAGELVRAGESAAEVAAGSAGRHAVVLAEGDRRLVADSTGADER
jgi:hypothetical protein